MIKKLLLIISFSTCVFAMGGASLVNTTKIDQGVVNPLEEFIGSVNFSQSAKVASQSSGVVLKVNFESGDNVKKGDILVYIDSEILDSQIKSARANVEIAKIDLENSQKDYDRYKELIVKKSISQKTYDDSLFALNSAKQTITKERNSLNELLIQKNKKTIKAPFDGVIVEKSIEVGEWTNSGQAVAELINTKDIDLTFNLPTSYIYKLSKDMKYNVSVGEIQLESKLYATIAKGSRLTRTFPVKFKAQAQNSFIYDGMEAKIKLPRAKKVESLIVPRDAVIKRFGQNIVFVNLDGKAMMFPVQIIGFDKQNVAIAGQGLVKGMDVVTKGNERIFPNQPLKSLNN